LEKTSLSFLSKESVMSRKSQASRRSSTKPQPILKANGKIDHRVQQVGPERFGIVTVDCAKSRSKWMLADFYAKVLVPPTVVEHTRAGMDAMLQHVRQAVQEHRLADVLIAVERTGNYHTPIQRCFRRAGFDTRVVHPFATKQFRQVDHPGVKTDDIDLAALHRATIVGFALAEQTIEPAYRQLQLLIRHRRDLVGKRVALRCQIREHVHLNLPGFTDLFGKHGSQFWDRALPMTVARHFASAAQIVAAGSPGLTQLFQQQGLRFQHPTLLRILAWAKDADPPPDDCLMRQRILADLDDDFTKKTQQITALEREIAGYLVQTPYILLLAIPGINVVSAADLAGEMGPIEHYANANAITGRAGLFPGRYQSDQVDHTTSLIRCGNKRLRDALMQIGDNLITCNDHFHGLAELWRARDVDPRLQRVRVVKQFSRLAFAMLASRQVFPHRCCQTPDYLLHKLLQFELDHATPLEAMKTHLFNAADLVPKERRALEAANLQEESQRRTGPRTSGGMKHIGEAIRLVVARLLGHQVQSNAEVQASD
jgi:transposase